MSNNTIPIDEDEEDYDSTLMGASLTLVVIVVGIISIVALATITVICFRRWKRKRAKTRFVVISPDGGGSDDNEDENKLSDMPMNAILQQEPKT